MLTPAGVTVAVPAGLRRAEGLAEWHAVTGEERAPLAVFTDGTFKPLVVVVQAAVPHALSSLPKADEGAALEWARSFATQLGVPQAYDFKPGRYDAERGSVSLSYKVLAPSAARQMLELPDSHPLWAPVIATGEDPSLARCLLEHLLAGKASATEGELRANYATAAQRCDMAELAVAEYVRQVGIADFAPVVSTIACVGFFTLTQSIVVHAIAPLEREQEALAASALIWDQSLIEPAVRLRASAPRSAFRAGKWLGIVLGAVLAIFGVGSALSWLLVRFGVSSSLAVGCAFGGLSLLALISVLHAGVSLDGAAQVLCYALASALGFRPLRNWLEAKWRRSPGPHQRTA